METFEGIRYRLLGPVELYHEGAAVDLASTKVRLMLTALALAPNTVVSFDQLGQVLWDDGAPPSARSNVRTYATTLRRVLDQGCRNRLVSRGGGYLLSTDPDELDVQVFGRLAEIGRRALADGEPASARTHLRQALGLWRGHPAEGLPRRRALAGALDALTEQRLLVEEDLLEAELAVGGKAELVGTARRLVTKHPLRERGWAALMLALYRTGDVAAALEAFAEARNRLVEGLGLEPGPRLQQLHTAMLNRDPALLDRPPATTVVRGGARCELPRQVGLVDRAEEVRTVVATLCAQHDDGPRVVVVHGPPGAGKSAVALRAAHQAAWCYPDGQRYVDLTDTPLDGAAWRSTLSGRRELVVVDHCMSATQLRPLLVAEPGCGFLVTADTPLAAVDATARIPVGRLSPAAAVAMLGKLVGRPRVTPDWAAAELVRRCDHLPLAIRAAAAVLIGDPRLTLPDLATRLAGDGVLDELAVDDLDPRARLLSRYRAMSTVDQSAAAAFQYLGTHGGSVGALTSPSVRRLVDHGLLEDGRMAPLTHRVAIELGTGPA
ncbi:AfsR/SARP family transcriptional regulator [Actinophytocola sp.]|jgi:DNA-binding SARP family transcriptional activator|uniref:AfsR/SARP family transcriptional regulator n=1 Tax=Actinophytocola sp. TaxID=1872138 RepID=UPI002EDA9E5B